MTGFGQAALENERLRADVRLRSVNHRGLDLNLRMPDDLLEWEQTLRGVLAKELERGRIEVMIKLERRGDPAVSVHVREAALEQLAEVGRGLEERGLMRSEISWAELVRMPEVVDIEVARTTWNDEDRALILEAMKTALAQLVNSRQREGEALAGVFEQRLTELEVWVEKLEGRREVVVEETGRKLQERLRQLLEQVELGEERLAQEVGLLVEKSDISEELDRLRAHLDHFGEIVAEGGPSGRRLNFLCQEILRELNTVGSKSRDTEMTQATVESKVVCEQIREQVQNVE